MTPMVFGPNGFPTFSPCFFWPIKKVGRVRPEIQSQKVCQLYFY